MENLYFPLGVVEAIKKETYQIISPIPSRKIIWW